MRVWLGLVSLDMLRFDVLYWFGLVVSNFVGYRRV